MEQLSQIKNIIFDFGGVIVDLDKAATVNAFRSLGFDAEAFVGTYGQGGPFAGLEIGKITSEQFYAEIARLSGGFARGASAQDALTPESIRAAWNKMLVGIPPQRLQKILSLRERYRVFLLSNTNVIHWDFSCDTLFSWQGHRPEDFFEHIYLSYEMHLLKPDEAIFHTVLECSGLRAEETIFIDDSKDNCRSAEGVGLHTFCPAYPDDWMNLF